MILILRNLKKNKSFKLIRSDELPFVTRSIENGFSPEFFRKLSIVQINQSNSFDYKSETLARSFYIHFLKGNDA
jgi:hypothetical protein